MAGLRIGFAVGNADAVDALAAYRSNVGYGTATLVQHAGAYALDHRAELVPPKVAEYRARRDSMIGAFKAAGWAVDAPLASMYLWLPVPEGVDDWGWVKSLIDGDGIVVTPGVAFGDGGRGYFRISLVRDVDTLRKAAAAIAARGRWPLPTAHHVVGESRYRRVTPSKGPRRAHRKQIGIAELRIDALVFGSNGQAPNIGLHAGAISESRVPRPLRGDRTALRVDLIEPAGAAVETIDVGVEPRCARLAEDVKEWKRQRQVTHTEGRDRSRMGVRAIVIAVVPAVSAGMSKIDVLEFRADD